MGLDNPLHIAVLLLILLMVFGAKRLPELGRSLGTGMRGFKESISGESHTTDHVEQLAATPAEAAPATQAVSTPAISAEEPVAAHSVRPAA
jgi:sec-independent protein translocase protein TatA